MSGVIQGKCLKKNVEREMLMRMSRRNVGGNETPEWNVLRTKLHCLLGITVVNISLCSIAATDSRIFLP